MSFFCKKQTNPFVRVCAHRIGRKYAIVNQQFFFFCFDSDNSMQKLPRITLHHYFNANFKEL